MTTRNLSITIQWGILIIISVYVVNLMLIPKFEKTSESSSNSLDIDVLQLSGLHAQNTKDESMNPWNNFDIDIIDILNNLESDKIDTPPKNTDEYFTQNNEIVIIHHLNHIDNKYKTCRSMRSSDIGYEIPIGIHYNKLYGIIIIYIHNKLKSCLIHSMDTYLAGLTMFNRFIIIHFICNILKVQI